MGNGKRVLVMGASGAVGQDLLKVLERETSIEEIVVITRRNLRAEEKTSKVKEYVVDFEALEESSAAFLVDAVFCAIGTTIKKAGSREEFERVDHDFPLEVAKIAKAKGVPHFLLVSALGAKADSTIFYNGVKGRVEKDLEALGFESLTIIRPSVLIRSTGERRLAESVGQRLGRLLPRKWKSVPTSQVALKMLASYLSPPDGVRVIENSELF